MKKTVRTIAICIFAAVLAVFCLFTTAPNSFLYARADSRTESVPAENMDDVRARQFGHTLERA